MDDNRFTDRLHVAWALARYVCVGLDPDPEQIRATTGSAATAPTIMHFTRAIVDATCDLVAAYKPNSAFFEQFGPAGMQALQGTISHIHSVAPGAVVILDAKRGDIEHTNSAYATAMFDVYDADAVTVHPYLGAAALAPFLDRVDRGVIVLCRTSNPGGGELQDLRVENGLLYQHVAEQVETTWNRHGNCGLLVGATYPRELKEVRARAPSPPLLIVGIGRQRGSLEAAVRAGATTDGGIIVSASRAITHAASDPNFATAARQACQQLNEQVLASLSP